MARWWPLAGVAYVVLVFLGWLLAVGAALIMRPEPARLAPES